MFYSLDRFIRYLFLCSFVVACPFALFGFDACLLLFWILFYLVRKVAKLLDCCIEIETPEKTDGVVKSIVIVGV